MLSNIHIQGLVPSPSLKRPDDDPGGRSCVEARPVFSPRPLIRTNSLITPRLSPTPIIRLWHKLSPGQYTASGATLNFAPGWDISLMRYQREVKLRGTFCFVFLSLYVSFALCDVNEELGHSLHPSFIFAVFVLFCLISHFVSFASDLSKLYVTSTKG